MLFLVSMLTLALSAYDAWFTTVRVRKHGIQVEINPLIRALAEKWGDPVYAVWVGVMIPTLLLIGLLHFVPPFLYMLAGARCTLFFFQVLAGTNARS